MKRFYSFLMLSALLFSSMIQAQPLFTYGTRNVSKEEFLKAWNKNNADMKPTDKAYRDYLDLYIRFKLKVQAALDQKLDTLPGQIAELKSFRAQIAESYMSDEASMKNLIDEAMSRSRREIDLSHIYIALSAGAPAAEIEKARAKAASIYARLQKGESFDKLAAEFSDDPEVRKNNGRIGYITTFVLPYDLENIVYATPVSKVSAPYQSAIGFHIFKNNRERPASGRWRIAQILIAFPPDPGNPQIEESRKLADSVYGLLQKGADFKDLALRFSNDNITYQTGGELPEFGTGRYAPRFEEAAYALANDGDISKPFATEFGYHILKRISRSNLQNDPANAAHREAYRQQIAANDRNTVARKMLIKKIGVQTGYKSYPVAAGPFKEASEAVLSNKPLPKSAVLKPSTPLFAFAKQQVLMRDWVAYLETVRDYANLRGNKTVQQLFDEYRETTSLEYYRDHLEDYNKDFSAQLREFREGNLLFEIMQRKIWDAAALDTAGLQQYYTSHKDKYWWEASANALIFTASSDSLAQTAMKAIQETPGDWRKLIEYSSGNLQGDSGRFELGQLPVLERTAFSKGLITAPVKNETDNSVTFCYILDMFMERAPRTFTDARGFVINDYQGYLEEEWVKQLKKKYPVKVNENVLNKLPKQE